jgi:hypothetical protein
MATRTLGSRHSARRSQLNLLEGGIRQVERHRHGVVRRAGRACGTVPDGLVQKVLERMMIDEARRIAL